MVAHASRFTSGYGSTSSLQQQQGTEQQDWYDNDVGEMVIIRDGISSSKDAVFEEARDD
jgi:aromatic ring hydroxylase